MLLETAADMAWCIFGDSSEHYTGRYPHMNMAWDMVRLT